MKFLILLIGLIVSTSAWADATPKMNPRIEVHFTKGGKTENQLDSIVCFVKYRSSESEDTLTRFYSTAIWWTVGGISQKLNRNYNLEFRSKAEYFRLGVVHEGKTYRSKRIYPISTWSYIDVEMKSDQQLVMKKSWFYNRYEVYFVAFLITLVLELIAIVFFKSLRRFFGRAALFVLLVNIVSHPLLWYFDTNYESNLALLEFGVMLVEFILLTIAFRKRLTWDVLLVYVLTANMLSWWLGGALVWINTH